MAKYIDKQVAIAALSEAYDKMAGLHPQFYNGYQSAAKQIRVCPTADVEPVKHGKWIADDSGYGDDFYTCSVCKDGCAIEVGTPKENNMRYCPYCGAKMDLEE